MRVALLTSLASAIQKRLYMSSLATDTTTAHEQPIDAFNHRITLN